MAQSGKSHLPGYRQPISHSIFTWRKAEWAHCLLALRRALVPLMSSLPSQIHLFLIKISPRPYLLTPSHWGVRVSTYEFGEDTNIQFITLVCQIAIKVSKGVFPFQNLPRSGLQASTLPGSHSEKCRPGRCHVEPAVYGGGPHASQAVPKSHDTGFCTVSLL